jgi:AraC-like DNA-binding protein
MRRPGPGARDRDAREELLNDAACRLVGAGWYGFPPSWGFTDRLMSNAIAYVITSGSAQFSLGGGSNTYDVGAGDVLLAAPEERHSLRNPPQEGSEFHTVHFMAQVYGGLDAISACGFPAVLRPEPAGFRRIVGLCREMVGELDRDHAGSELLANAACAQMLGLAWREGAERLGPPGADGARGIIRLAPVFREVHTRYADPLTLRGLADVVHLSPSYFSGFFKEVTGVSPLRYVANYRLARARELLLSSDKSVGEVAAATGFRDPFYLSRVMKHAEGVSPREFRRKQPGPGLP